MRGADLIALVTHDSVDVRTLIANLHHVGRAGRGGAAGLQAAPPLGLRALAAARGARPRRLLRGPRLGRALRRRSARRARGTLRPAVGARTLRRFLGRWLGLVVGIVLGVPALPAQRRGASGRTRSARCLVQLFGAVTTLTGTAALSLDAERATRVADVLEPFSVLPERLDARRHLPILHGLREIGREKPARGLSRRSRRCSGASTTRGTTRRCRPTTRRALRRPARTSPAGRSRSCSRGRPRALESADALDASGLQALRDDREPAALPLPHEPRRVREAAAHREQVELHAAHVGSAWQVETWEAAA